MIGKKTAVGNLKEIKRILDKLNIKYWLDWGLLLGAVRDGKIIEWAPDLDLGTMDDCWKKIVSAVPELEKRGLGVHFEEFKVDENLFAKRVMLHRFGCPIGI